MDEVRNIKASRVLPTSAAASLRGKLMHLADAYDDRIGKAPFRSISVRADGLDKSSSWNTGRELDTSTILYIFESHRFRHISVVASRPRITVWSDASFDWRDGFPSGRLCYIASMHRGVRFGKVFDVPLWLFRAFAVRTSYITQLETLPILPLLILEVDTVVGTSAVHYVDNMGAFSGLATGASSVCDFGSLLHGILLRQTQLGFVPWYEWIPLPRTWRMAAVARELLMRLRPRWVSICRRVACLNFRVTL